MFVSQAESLMQEEKYAEAIAKLDEAITLDPGNGQAYFDRASSYFALTSHQRSFGEFLDYLQQARADIDRAIALGPAIGDYYIKRQYIYNTLAYSQVYRVDFIRLEEIALENSRIANQLGNTEQDSDRDPPAALFSLNRCEEGLAETRQLIAARGADTPPSEGLDTMLAKGYLCQGKLDQALEYINSAIELAPMWGRSWTKIIILYNMGRLDGALAMLNESITNDPYYVGDRYFLRAAIYADQGKLAEAEADIKFGSGQTWERNGIASYAEALAALGRGDHISALEKFQDAEATINYDYGPLLKRIQREIASLGGHLITVTPQPFLSTPIDTPQVTATQHFTSTKKFSTPTSSTTTPVPPPEAATFPLELGTGPITLESGDNSVFHFKPLAPIKFTRIVSLTFRMIPINDNQNASILQLMPWNLKDGGWGLVDNLKWSDNSIPNYRNYVSPEGDIYTSLRNWGAVGVNFQNMGFILLVELDDGSQVTYGLK
jgi:tetratricopeptide (TPR) repeat protein